MQNIFWAGYSHDDRHTAIQQIRHLISEYGDIVNVHLFSDVSIHFTVEIQESEVDVLHEALTQVTKMNPHEPLNSRSARERVVYFHLTFVRGTGDLQLPVPAVPG